MVVVAKVLFQFSYLSICVLSIWGLSISKLAVIRAMEVAALAGEVYPETAFAIVIFGVLTKMNGHYREACTYAELGVKLLQKFPSGSQCHSRAFVSAYVAVLHTSRPFSSPARLV